MADEKELSKAFDDFDKALENTGVDASTDTEQDLTDERRRELRKKYPALTSRR